MRTERPATIQTLVLLADFSVYCCTQFLPEAQTVIRPNTTAKNDANTYKWMLEQKSAVALTARTFCRRISVVEALHDL